MVARARARSSGAGALVLVAVGAVFAAAGQEEEEERPPVVDPGGEGAVPSDAVVLFDGTDLAAWQQADGGEPRWKIEDGALGIEPGTGALVTRRAFGDCQLHLEFATPREIVGEGQERGNSGVYLQSRYEVQVLDSHQNDTYANGQCGALYGVAPPLVNVSRGPGEWQSYDIVFRAARFDDSGNKVANARFTVLHNGVLIHDAKEVLGPTGAAPQKETAGPAPLYLQDHGSRVRYRNVWLRPLGGEESP